jgi:ligand-binding sensor domain-containing protein
MHVSRLALLAAFLACAAGSPAPARGLHSPVRFDHLSTAEGLSQDIAWDVVQDSLGFIWIGTENGLNRYDGYEVQVFKHRPGDSTSIPSNWCGPLVVDGGGDVWVGTSSGLARYNQRRGRFERVAVDGRADRYVVDVAVDGQGNVWMSTGDTVFAGVGAPGGTRAIPFPHVVRGQGALLSPSRSGGMLACGGEGVYRAQRETGRLDRVDLPLRGVPVRAVYEDPDGTLWVAFVEEGVGRLEPGGRWTLFGPRAAPDGGIADTRTFCVARDSRGVLWAGTFAGLERFDARAGRFEAILPRPDDTEGLQGSRVHSIFEDRSGILWLGTYHGGVNRIVPAKQRFGSIRPARAVAGSPPDDAVLAVCEGAGGELWVGGSAGVGVRPPGASGFFHFRHEPRNPASLPAGGVTAIVERRNGEVWVATGEGALARYDRSRRGWNRFTIRSRYRKSVDFSRALFEDAKGRLWAGFNNGSGLHRFDDASGGWVPAGQLGGDSTGDLGVHTLFETREGEMYAGVWGTQGVIRVDRESENGTAPFARPVVASVRSMVQDESRTIWMATWGAGLIGFMAGRDTVRTFNELNGLPSDYAKGVLLARGGDLWVSTEKGIARISPATGEVRAFEVRDGLPGDFFYSGACARGRDGTLYFGGDNGLTFFHPDSIRGNPHPPVPVITRFSIYDRPVDLGAAPAFAKEVRVLPGQEFFSFEFVGLEFTDPARNRLSYLMEGLDDEWHDAGSRRYASYTHLDPGKYRFRVRAANSDGVWSTGEASLTVVVVPAFWQTWWFTLLVIGAAGAILYALYRYRLNKLLAVERTRNSIARDLHDEVGATLGSISFFARAIRTDAEQKGVKLPERYLQLITDGSAQAQEAMSDIVWAIDPAHDTWDQLLAKFQRYASDLFESRGIRYRIVLPDVSTLPPLSMERRRNLWLVLKEMAANIARHSGAAEAEVTCMMEGEEVLFVVRDDGRGFDPSLPTSRNGVKNIRLRSEALGGRLTLETAPGAGTRWELRLPVNAAGFRKNRMPMR